MENPQFSPITTEGDQILVCRKCDGDNDLLELMEEQEMRNLFDAIVAKNTDFIRKKVVSTLCHGHFIQEAQRRNGGNKKKTVYKPYELDIRDEPFTL